MMKNLENAEVNKNVELNGEAIPEPVEREPVHLKSSAKNEPRKAAVPVRDFAEKSRWLLFGIALVVTFFIGWFLKNKI